MLLAQAVSAVSTRDELVPKRAPRMMQSIKESTAQTVVYAFSFIVKVNYSVISVIAQFILWSR
jgi:hypothetical protein